LNLEELGFSKLRNLVVSFSDIKVESFGKNHFYLSLAEEQFKNISKNSPKLKKDERSYLPILVDLSSDSISKIKNQGPNPAANKKVLSINSEEVVPRFNFSTQSPQY
jgi:hypothetical protein